MRMEDQGTPETGNETAENRAGKEISKQAAPVQVSPQAVRVVPDDGVVRLPAGVDLEDVRVAGNDLLVLLPDGTQWLIVNGAVTPPMLVMGNVQIPSANVAALLESQQIQPAAGPPQSSGGNFAIDVGGIGDPFALGDLLGPTDLSFDAQAQDEVLFPFPDEDPGVIVITPDNPVGSPMATATVQEPGLPNRGPEPPGTNAPAPVETTAGTVTVTSGDGPFVITVNGTVITTVGQVITTPTGTLTITSITADTFGYTYTLTDNTSGDTATEVFTVTVTDSDGDVATGTLTITIVDDNPLAVANVNSVTEGGVLTVSAAAGVLTNDVPGADGFAAGGGVVGVRAAAGNVTTAVTTGVGTSIQGQFGTLVLQANGSYVYTSTPNAVPPAGGSDVFVYTIRDGDGDQATTTLTITLSDGGLTATPDDAVVVDEAALPIGSNPSSTAETATGTLVGNATGGTGPYTYALVGSGTGSYGTLTLNANGTYSYTLATPYDTSPDANNGTNVENNRDTFTYRVTDAAGNTTTSTISIDIVDDVPTAVANLATVGEGAAVSGNVVTNDVFGADGPAAGGGVVGVRAAGGDTTTAVTTGTGNVIQGLFGTLTLNANGTYTYVSTPNAAPAGGATDVFVYTIRDGDGDQSTTTLTITINDGGLVATPDDAVVVNEAALPIGSNPGSTAETATGTLADGNASGGTGPYTYALVGSGTGTYGTLTLNADGSYSYTLATPYDTSPDANNGTNVENDRDTFTYRVTDANGNTTTSTISIDIIDDVPTANPNANSVTEGAVLTVNAANGVVPNDVFGADGPAAGGGVVGVRAAGGNTTTAVTTGVGNVIQGQFGTLTLQANGSYVYDANPNVGPATDVFVYTIRDGDGDQSTSTLTINIGDGTLAATPDDAVVVNEAALAIGSNPASTAETATGTLADGNVNGGTGPYTYALVGSPTGAYGTLTLNPNGTYSYTLQQPYDTSPDANNGTNVENNRDTFTYQVTDANGNTTTSTISIDIVDDVPTANPNTNGGIEGAIITGNVVPNDVFGADGPGAGGGVLGVRAAGGDTTTAVATGVGAVIAGQFGNLVLQANGSYSYDGNPNVVPPAGATDVFVYTIRDGDGDQSTSTLTITLTDSGLAAPTDADVTVNENALDLTQSGADLAPGTVTGSLPGSTAETDNSANQLNATGGTGPYTYALQAGGNAVTAGLYGSIQINSNGSYVYTLTKAFDNATANDGVQTISAAESFTYVATDANGNTVTGTINIAIVDDVPTAVADLNSVAQGALLTVNAAAGILSNDSLSADGTNIAGVRAQGGDSTTPVTNGNLVVVTALGTLTVAADGSYTYDANPNVGPATDTFVYTILDGDGDLSTTTLTINIGGPSLAAPDDADATVNEAGLDLNQDGADLVAGTVIGSLPGATSETDNSANQLNATGGTGPYTYELVVGGNAVTTGTYGSIQLNSNGTYTYTLRTNFDNPDAADGVQTITNAESFQYRVTDNNGNTATGFIRIAIVDDVPTATADSGNVQEGALLTVPATGILGNDVAGADGAVIAGVRAAGGDTTTAVTNGNLVVVTALGTLTVSANGSYTYDANPNTGPATDTFVYTMRDGDGDLSTTTLTINITDSGLAAPTDGDATVNEAGLDPNQDGADLVAGTVTGSLPGATSETDNTANQLNASGGTGPYTYALQVGGNAVTAGTYGSIQLNSDGTYTYTLRTNYDNPDAADGVQTLNGIETFTYVVTDANGNTATGTIDINIVDDVPTANADSGNVQEGALLSVPATGILSNDVAGADGAAIAGVRAAGGDTTTAVTNGNLVVVTALGTLTVAADGSYTYDANANVGPATDTFVYTIRDGDGDLSTTTLTIDIADSNLAAPTDTDASVNEAGLDPNQDGADLAPGTVTGSLPGTTSETDSTGNQLNASGGTGPYTYALQTGGNAVTAGTYGSIQLNSDGTYTYTLTANYDNPDANDGAQPFNGIETFTYVVTDANGNTATGTFDITIVDDVPTATADSGNVAEGALLSVPATGILSNDVAGADGAAIAGVRAAGGDTTTAVTNGNLVVATALGTLTVSANGSYTYQANANVGPATDTFVYTIRDGDGDLSTTTLTINIADSNLAAPTDTDATVNEAGLDPNQDGADLVAGTVTGSLPGTTSETDNTANQLNASGGTGPYSYALQVGGNAVTAGTYGSIQLNSDGTYTYTLRTNYDNPDANDGAQPFNGIETFTYVVTDANGNTATGTIDITIVDDVPTATADSGNVAEGALLSVPANGILTNDTAGADGAAIAGVRAAGGDTTTAVTNGNLVVATALGTLTVSANGSYTYQANANVGPATDTFVYTIRDGDGDLSTTTLTISIADSGLAAPTDTDATVNEAGLDPNQDGADLVAGTVTGSLPGTTSETDNTANQLNASGGTGPYTYALQVGGNAVTAGTYGSIQLNSDGTYTYTLRSAYDNADANDGVQTINGAETFTYVVTDANGNTATGTISVAIVDDVPTATADSGNVQEGALLSVAASGILTNDTAGADGAAIAGVRAAGGDTTTAVTNGNLVVATALGTLTVSANGSYTYDANPNVGPATDTFVYTIRDGDGDLSTTTLTINITDSGLAAPTDTDATVNEAGLDPNQDGADLVGGTVTGSLAGATSETDNTGNQLNASGGTGPYTYALQVGGNAVTAGTYGSIQLNSNGTYTYTLRTNYDNPDANDGAQPFNGIETFTYVVTDANGNTATGTIDVTIVDDVPTAAADSGNVQEGALLSVAATGILGNDTAGADGVAIAGVRAAGGDTTTAVTNGNLVVATALGTLTVSANGSYTYDANPNTGPATDTFVYTIRDGDGDLSTTTLTINITDSGLAAPTDSDVTVNEAGLDPNQDGADLAPGTVTGSLPATTTETDNSANQLNASGGTGPYTYALQAGGNAVTAGTYGSIQVNSDGTYTYTLTKNYLNPTANDGVQTINAAESFTYVVTDANGNTTTGTINIAIVDDVPTAVQAVAMTTGLVNVAGGTATRFLDDDSDVDNDYEADGPGKVFFEQSLEASATGLTSGGGQTVLYDVSADGLILTGYVNVGAAGYVDGVDTKVFTIELQPAGLPDQYRVTIFQPLDSKTTIDFGGAGYDFEGGNNGWNGFIPVAEDLGNIVIDNNSKDILLTPEEGGLPSGTINTNANEGGVSNPAISGTEVFRVDYVTDLRGDPAGGNYSTAANRDHLFDGHYTVNGGSAVFASTGGSTVKIEAFDDPDGNNVVGDGVQDTITSIAIKFGAASLTIVADGVYNVGGQSYTVDFTGGYVTVAGVVSATTIAVFTANGFNSLEYGHVAGQPYAIGDFGADAITTSDPVTFSVPISIMDGDGDVTASGNLTITASPPPPVVLDLDGDGVEFVDRSAGVAFDYNGDGTGESTGWVAGDDGLLVRDANGDGKANDGSEIIFSVDGSSDLEGVRISYDSDGDGKLTAADADFAKFGVWQDANGNGRTDAGEYRTLAEAGIVSIDLSSDGVGYSPNADVRVVGSSTYTRADGSTGALADAVFGTSAEQRAAAQASANQLTSSLVAAGLVATAGASAQAAAAETSVSAAPYQPLLETPILLDRSDLPTVDASRSDFSAKLSPMADVAQPIRAAASHADDASAAKSLDSGADAPAAARPAAAEAQDAGPAGLVDHSALPVAAPMVDASAALLAAPAETLAAVVADALPQAADGPDIDALLSGLPASDAIAAPAGDLAAVDQPFDAAAYNITAFMDANMITHDAVMSTAQA